MPWSLRTSSASTVPREPQRPAGVGRRGRAATGLVTTGALAAAASLATAPAEAAADLWSSRIAAGAWAPMTTAAGVPFAADRGFVGASSVVDSGVPIARTADDAFYQRNRWGMDAYRLDVPCAAQYDVTLHFAEIVFRDPGRRVFDVDVEDSGRQRVDVVAAVGPHAALSLTRRVPVVDGRVDITFHDVVDDAMVSALEVVQATTCDEVAPPAPPTPGPTTLPTPPPTTPTAPPELAPVARINVGSAGAATDRSGAVWTPDSMFVGGQAWGPAGVPVAGTEDDALFVKNRWGMSGYRVPVPTAGTYRVELRFAEVVFDQPGRRVFDVSAEGRTLLSRFDAITAAGFATAITRTFDVTVTDGTLDVGFGRVVEDPMLSGLTVTPVSTSTPPPPVPTTPPPPAPTTPPPPAPTTPPPPVPTTPPVSSGFPDASTTGVPAGTALTPSGSLTITTDGTVIDARDVNGSIYVNANNVTIKRTRIRNAGGTGINIVPGKTGILIEDVELDGTGNPDASEAIKFGGYTARRVHIHHYGEGFRANSNVLIEDSYAHSFTNYIAAGAHQDAIQSTGGSNLTFRHNTLLMNVDGGNAAIMMGTYHGTNVLVQNNLVAGGSYVLYGGGDWTNVRFIDNRISTRYFPRGGYFGVFTYADNALKTGNLWHETGQPL